VDIFFIKPSLGIFTDLTTQLRCAQRFKTSGGKPTFLTLSLLNLCDSPSSKAFQSKGNGPTATAMSY
jgi:hypothetical protein